MFIKIIRNVTMSIFLILLATACQSAITEINRDIPNSIDPVSSKGMLPFISTILQEYHGIESFEVGKVTMNLDGQFEGQIKIMVKTTNKVLEISIDSKKKKVLTIRKMEKHSKLDPGTISLDKWKIDSKEAINIALEKFSNEIGFKVENIYLTTISSYKGKEEVWSIDIQNSSNKTTYWCNIDPYSRNIIDFGSRKM
ncbi:hypothetical protein [Brevibacillus sp. SYSU BS000544]|uniref:hypothetical protein n=1 Tax=Brevibacillus sp. SYSU BS000544 TaxID=3416443 RepID=UPI003CE4E20B